MRIFRCERVAGEKQAAWLELRHPEIRKTLAGIILQGFCGGDSWTRTNDPIDVNDVLSRFFFDTQPLYKCHIWFFCFNDNKSLHTDKSFVYIVNDARKSCFYNTK